MKEKTLTIKRALLSVYDKTDIVSFATFLASEGVSLISTGGTYRTLKESGLDVTEVSEVTRFPEMMNGRVKTLHPLIHGGILGRRGLDDVSAAGQGIEWIDLVVCNLYPFEQTIGQDGVTQEEAIEKIDIGGPSMIRSAAKNFYDVAVVTRVSDYRMIMDEITTQGGVSYPVRKHLSAAAFSHTARYDSVIQSYLNEEQFPQELTYGFIKDDNPLRYGENPHQKASVYRSTKAPATKEAFSLLDARQLQGKKLSFNNLGDTWGALETLREFTETTCVVVKHASPCGVASDADLYTAVKKAYEADSLSAFGSIIACNREVTEQVAAFVKPLFVEVLIAPSFTPEALEILKAKKNLRVLALPSLAQHRNVLTARFIGDDLLVQEKDTRILNKEDLRCVTRVSPDEKTVEELLFAWNVVKHVKSNAILTVSDFTTCGIGGGQVSRVDATKIALRKSPENTPMVLASDAFFPFKDSIEALAGYQVRAIIQPGGSIRDQEVIDACDEAGIAMVFTGVRSFLHA